MTDLDQRIAALREAVGKMTPGEWVHYDDRGSTERQEIAALGVTVARCYAGNPNGVDDAAGIVALRNHALAIIDEQQREIASRDAEIERLRARVAELESRLGEWRGLTSHLERLRDAEDERMDVIGQNGNDGLHYTEAEAGPTPLRGRITRRTT